MVNLDDTRRCPVGPECESCGRLEELAVLTGDTPVGVLCMTLCDTCEVAGVLPIFSPVEESARVLEHGQHVGVDLDQMAGGGRPRITREGSRGRGNPRPGWLPRGGEATEQPLAD